MKDVVFEKDGQRECWTRFPGGDRGGWIRPNDEFLTTQEAISLGWKKGEESIQFEKYEAVKNDKT